MESHPRPGWFQTCHELLLSDGLFALTLRLQPTSPYTIKSTPPPLPPSQSSIVLRSPDHLIKPGCGELWAQFLNWYLPHLLPLNLPPTIDHLSRHIYLGTCLLFQLSEPLYLSDPFLLLYISILPAILQSKLCLLPSYISWSLYSPYLLIAYHITLPPSIYCIKFADSLRHITGSILIYQSVLSTHLFWVIGCSLSSSTD